MKKILFSHSYFLRFDPKQWATGQPYAPLGTLYAASLMRENGYTVSLFDTMFAHGAEEVLPSLDHFQPDFFVIYDDGFNYLTKMCLTNMREAAFRMSKLARERGCTVIVSSSDSTDHYEQYLQEGADFVVLGEGEVTLAELIQAINKGATSFTSIPGLAYRQGDAVIKTGKRPVIRELDALPFPAWDLIEITPYRAMWLKSSGYFSMNMGTTRGCPFKCNWCAKPIYGNRYNSRSPQNVVQELKLLKEQYHFDHIWFCDDIFGLKPGWVQEFAELTEQENLPLRFKIQSRADLLVQENYVRSLARAGCENTWMGAESGSQEILDAMDKGTTIEQIYTATKLLKEHGIRPSFFIQFGYPGETKEDIRKTIRMIRELMPAELGISVSYPLPGTVFYERVKNELQEKANWTDSDELQLMFKNTYPPAFYKRLHRHVHHVYRTRQGWMTFKKALKNPFALKLADYKKVVAACLYLPQIFIGKWQLKQLSYE
ncbi:B12-binding domain-containing radical SAM protein [Pseudoflavitalea sp. X16]|uniref:B12-binding domain-containing radical SAM protein n=1 Tax=Paraflavitalea devenefica TaxID=2716334 RepID=UPI001420A0F9|nr:radical SAM protein [Paraflavitalea devenefica]NII27265.1 B12-binding domain-containing radical SAM protein [Paraflavitalea devenefica]